ncbi:MAG: hypothetical protein R3B54_11350 [Bdellovibrionota bacterium]
MEVKAVMKIRLRDLEAAVARLKFAAKKPDEIGLGFTEDDEGFKTLSLIDFKGANVGVHVYDADEGMAPSFEKNSKFEPLMD